MVSVSSLFAHKIDKICSLRFIFLFYQGASERALNTQGGEKKTTKIGNGNHRQKKMLCIIFCNGKRCRDKEMYEFIGKRVDSFSCGFIHIQNPLRYVQFTLSSQFSSSSLFFYIPSKALKRHKE